VKARAALAVLAICIGACAPALKDVRPTLTASDAGTIWFATPGTLVPTPDSARFITGAPVVLSGELRFPAGAGPFPAIVLAHGCGGRGNAEAGWSAPLRDWGYATFELDSFTGRRLIEVCTNARALTGTQRIPDAYGALRVLATHPKIDARRIALMGFSHGGVVALRSATVWAKDTFAPAGQPSFRAFLPFYPFCNTIHPERERIAAPVRIHTGELDDWTPAAPCVRLVDLLRGTGQDATITVYKGAHHSFDNVGRPVTHLPAVDNAAACTFNVKSLLEPAFPPASELTCLRKGATIGASAEATTQARQNVRTQLTDLLK
jgi:dienelactone hydrolase